MSLLQITKWNYERNGLQHNQELEELLWAEESKEFRKEVENYLSNPLNKLEVVAAMIKEFCDCNFVYYGNIMRQLGNTKVVDRNFEISLMNTLLTEILIKHKVQMFKPEEDSVINLCLDAVIAANEAKPKTKTTKKVSKGSDYVDPTAVIIDVLLDRGFEEYPEVVKEADAN